MTELTPDDLAHLRAVAEAAIPDWGHAFEIDIRDEISDFQHAWNPQTALAVLDGLNRLTGLLDYWTSKLVERDAEIERLLEVAGGR